VRPGLSFRVVVIVLLTVLAVMLGGFPKSMAVMGATSRSEIERRLELPPFAYVAETEHDYSNIQQNIYELHGKLAFIDSITDLLVDSVEPDLSTIIAQGFNVFRFDAGSSLQEVAVSPDGNRIYVTDAYQPFLHVFDAESHQYLMAVELPGVEPKPPLTMEDLVRYNPMSDEKIPYSLFFENCSSDVACTPDGQTVLVSSSAGLQVIDADTNQVTKTISDINGTLIAISFDGSRAYIGTDNLAELEPRSYADWFKMILNSEEFSLLMLDLNSWEVLAEIKTYAIGGIAVRPDEPEVYFSESFQKRVRVVDALTLEDLYWFDTEPSFSFGIGFLPDGSKAYTVCSADVALPFLEQTPDFELPKAEDFFCAVFNTKTKTVIKKIPLEAF
jgi:DNA-binding beta-propeller fold protein YncE